MPLRAHFRAAVRTSGNRTCEILNGLQGLGIDARSGKILNKAVASHADTILAEQEVWAVQTDRKHGAEWVENVGVLGGKAIDKTGCCSTTLPCPAGGVKSGGLNCVAPRRQGWRYTPGSSSVSSCERRRTAKR